MATHAHPAKSMGQESGADMCALNLPRILIIGYVGRERLAPRPGWGKDLRHALARLH